jgi:hypothetical protein
MVGWLVGCGGTKESLSSLSISWICPAKIQILRPSTAVSLDFNSDWQWVCSGRDGAHLLTGTVTSSRCFSLSICFRLALLLGGFRAFSEETGDSVIEYEVLLIQFCFPWQSDCLALNCPFQDSLDVRSYPLNLRPNVPKVAKQAISRLQPSLRFQYVDPDARLAYANCLFSGGTCPKSGY